MQRVPSPGSPVLVPQPQFPSPVPQIRFPSPSSPAPVPCTVPCCPVLWAVQSGSGHQGTEQRGFPSPVLCRGMSWTIHKATLPQPLCGQLHPKALGWTPPPSAGPCSDLSDLSLVVIIKLQTWLSTRPESEKLLSPSSCPPMRALPSRSTPLLVTAQPRLCTGDCHSSRPPQGGMAAPPLRCTLNKAT